MRNHKCGCKSQGCNSCNPCNKRKNKTPPCCPATAIPDSFFTDFLAALDACNVGPADPFAAPFAPDVLAILALFTPAVTECGPATQLYGLQAVLENRAVFCENSLSVTHTLTNIQRFTFTGCDLTAVLSTNIVIEFAPGFGLTGTQEIKMKFNEQCKIATYVINTVGTIGPIGPVPGLAARSAPANDARAANILRALGSRK